MGGRGSSSGISDNGKRYGAEYKTLAQFGNIKIIKRLDGNTTAPMETMTKGRIYATVDKNNNIKFITFYDVENERNKQIDVKGPRHKLIDTPHTHIGYEHDEVATRNINEEEMKIVNYALQLWNKRRKKIGL